MVDLKKLTKTINDLGQEANRVKGARELLDKAAEIQRGQQKNEEKYASLINEISRLEELLNDNVEAYKSNLTEIEERHLELVKKYSELKDQLLATGIEQAQEISHTLTKGLMEQQSLIKAQNVSLHTLNEQQQETNNEILKLVQSISSENTKLYLESKEYINAKLDVENNKVMSNLSSLHNQNQEKIDRLESTLSRSLEQLNSKVGSMDSNIQEEVVKQEKKMKTVVVLVAITLFSSLGSLAVGLLM